MTSNATVSMIRLFMDIMASVSSLPGIDQLKLAAVSYFSFSTKP
jgi:hypothetical protein